MRHTIVIAGILAAGTSAAQAQYGLNGNGYQIVPNQMGGYESISAIEVQRPPVLPQAPGHEATGRAQSYTMVL
jgi:hypothetical protein